MAGLPDPERDRQFYEGVPPRRLVAWFVDLAIVLLVGVPLAVLFGLLTLGFGFALFPLDRRRHRLPLPRRDHRRRLGDLGHALHRHRVPPRRRHPLRPALRRSCTPAIYAVCFGVFVLQLDQLRDHPLHPLPPEPRRHHPRHHRDQPPGRVSRCRGVHPRRRILLPALDSLLLPSRVKGERIRGRSCATACRSRISSM